MGPESDGETKRWDLLGESWVEPDDVPVDGQAAVASLNHVHGTGHGAQVDAFSGRTALNVGDVAGERLLVGIPGFCAVGARLYPRVHHPRQRGTVRGASDVILDVAGDVVGFEGVSQLGEYPHQLVGREQVEQHDHIGLLGGLVAIDGVVLGLEDAVEA